MSHEKHDNPPMPDPLALFREMYERVWEQATEQWSSLVSKVSPPPPPPQFNLPDPLKLLQGMYEQVWKQVLEQWTAHLANPRFMRKFAAGAADPATTLRDTFDAVWKQASEQWEHLLRNPHFLALSTSLMEQSMSMSSRVQEMVAVTIKSMHLPTRDDYDSLTDRLDHLVALLENVVGVQPAPPKPVRARKTGPATRKTRTAKTAEVMTKAAPARVTKGAAKAVTATKRARAVSAATGKPASGKTSSIKQTTKSTSRSAVSAVPTKTTRKRK